MAAVRSTGNKSTEKRLVSIMREHGIVGWRRNQNLPGKPDFLFKSEKVAVFVDGCFWHGCSEHCRMPKSNTDYWETKIAYNVRRDHRVDKVLRRNGWSVLRVWEHSLAEPARVIIRLRRLLQSRDRA